MKCFFFDGAEAAVPWAAVLEGSLDIVLCVLVWLLVKKKVVWSWKS